MKNLKIFLILTLLLIPFSIAQFGYNNPTKPKLLPQERDTITTSGGGGNVTSVTSSTNCITVNPTTGDVILTFNASCASGSTYNSTYHTWAYNQTTAVFTMTTLNNTIAMYGSSVGFNSTFNSTYAPWAYNQTFNNNTGSVNRSNCWKDDCAGFRNPFNQWLNTTNTPTFNGLTSNSVINSYIAGVAGEWLRFGVLGGAIPVGHITAENGYFQIEPFGGFDIYIGNLSKVAFRGTDTGYFDAVSSSGVRFYHGASTVYEGNTTLTTIASTNGLRVSGGLNVTLNANIVNNLTVSGSINATRDICVTNGGCLNESLTVKSQSIKINNSLIYWNSTAWIPLNKTMGNNLALVYCSVGGLSWIDNTAGVCPL